MDIAEVNKVYGVYSFESNKFVLAFDTKEDVEDYLQLCGTIVSCYNPHEDSWTTSGGFVILPIDRVYANGLRLSFHKKICNSK